MGLCESFPKYDEYFYNKYICTGRINLKLLSWKNLQVEKKLLHVDSAEYKE